MNWAYWLTLAVLGLCLLDSVANFIASASKNGKGLCCWSEAIEGTLGNKRKFHSQYCPTILLNHLFVPSLPMPGMMDMGFVDTFLAFQKGVLLFITTFCIIYVFLHALIFYQPVWTPKATFQTVENDFLIGQVFFVNWHFSPSTEPILLSSGERVSVSVKPCILSTTCMYMYTDLQ